MALMKRGVSRPVVSCLERLVHSIRNKVLSDLGDIEGGISCRAVLCRLSRRLGLFRGVIFSLRGGLLLTLGWIMLYVQAHEWCFACVGWSDPCSGNDVHPHMHLQWRLEMHAVSGLVLVSCVGYLTMAIGCLNVTFRLSSSLFGVTRGEPRSDLCVPLRSH
jgi:hypothetical protein